MSNQNVTTLKPRNVTPSTKGEPPAAPETHNLSKPSRTAHVQLQFQVPPAIRREVKAYAAENEMKLTDLFQSMWEQYRRPR